METKPDAEGTADQKDVDRDSEGVYYMSVEDFERRRPPRPRPDDGRGRR